MNRIQIQLERSCFYRLSDVALECLDWISRFLVFLLAASRIRLFLILKLDCANGLFATNILWFVTSFWIQEMSDMIKNAVILNFKNDNCMWQLKSLKHWYDQIFIICHLRITYRLNDLHEHLTESGRTRVPGQKKKLLMMIGMNLIP